jgi:hypothetical protein
MYALARTSQRRRRTYVHGFVQHVVCCDILPGKMLVVSVDHEVIVQPARSATRVSMCDKAIVTRSSLCQTPHGQIKLQRSFLESQQTNRMAYNNIRPLMTHVTKSKMNENENPCDVNRYLNQKAREPICEVSLPLLITGFSAHKTRKEIGR